VVGTTTEPQLLTIPLANPSPSVAPQLGVASYFALLISAVDAAGHSSIVTSVNVQ
jgi:hypothetical protein